MEAAYQSAESPVGAELVEALLSRHLEDMRHYRKLRFLSSKLLKYKVSMSISDNAMESTLTRQGYGLKELVQNFDAKPAEIKALFANQLDPTRAGELRDRMRLAGLPI